MTEAAIIALVLFAVLFVAGELWQEWLAARKRRKRDDLRHVLGGRQWWGKR